MPASFNKGITSELLLLLLLLEASFKLFLGRAANRLLGLLQITCFCF